MNTTMVARMMSKSMISMISKRNDSSIGIWH